MQLIRIYCGIYFITAAGKDYGLNLGVNIVILMVIVISQQSFNFIWAKKIYLEILIIAYQHRNKKIFEYLTCKMVNKKKFYKDYIY